MTFTCPRVFRHFQSLAVLAGLVCTDPIAAQEGKLDDDIATLQMQLADLQRQINQLEQSKTSTEPRPLNLGDALTWKTIRRTDLARDGAWFAYWVAPSEGKSSLTVRQTQGNKEHTFDLDEGSVGSMDFSHDGKWFAFAFTPKSEKDAAKKGPSTTAKGKGDADDDATVAKVTLLNLETGKQTKFEGINRFAFSGEMATHIAFRKAPESPRRSGSSASRSNRDSSSSEAARGTDLIVQSLDDDTALTLGNVAEFAFNKDGRWLALVINSQGQIGNGVQLRDMKSGVLRPLDSGKASYQKLNWTKEGDGLTVLKGVEDKKYKDKCLSVLGFRDFDSANLTKVVYDPTSDDDFPAGMTISSKRTPRFAEDLAAIYFGIHELEEAKDDKKAEDKQDKDDNKEDTNKSTAKAKSRRKLTLGQKKARDKPDLVIWHWKDRRLQSMQQVQENRDKDFNYLCVYHIDDEKFVRLADDDLRQVSIAPKDTCAVGRNREPYERMGNLDGRRFADVYVIDLKTGERTLALEKSRWYYGASPDGRHLLYYRDGHYYSYGVDSGERVNITEGAPVRFVDTEDDHNVIDPPTRQLDWTEDGTAVLLSDNWDIWKVPANGKGRAENLTGDGREEGLRYRSISTLDPEAEGVDLSETVYLTVFGEWTKKSGFTRLDPDGTRTELCWDDAAFSGLRKAEDADIFLYTRQTSRDYPNYYVTDLDFDDPEQITDVTSQQNNTLWSSGVKLLDYQSEKGDRLQGSLYLPANYEEGKTYPTIVYIYERLSNRMHFYSTPRTWGINVPIYTSNGYAVLMPDITYTVNDPGMSAVWCVLPALRAAIDMGVVDKERVGLHGHSWGGYQTAFLITQTDAFKAAVAGAPLTNLLSMYSSIYWNTGSANQPIFESSQGRFRSGYWDHLDDYTRNSPVYFANKVQTPLLLLHNDKDGAVDWNQGIEYYNTLRRLNKPVVMLQYKGENHGLAKDANRRDYALRMREFFDHHLMGKDAPKWLKEGVPHLKMDEHLTERAERMEKLIDGKEKTPTATAVEAGGGGGR